MPPSSRACGTVPSANWSSWFKKPSKRGSITKEKLTVNFGWRTLSAVIQFQKAKFGLDDADGVVGPITAEALGVPWPGAAPDEMVCRPMAVETRAITGECRCEGSDALGPDGTRFAKKCRKGVYNYGKTTIGDFIRLNRTAFADVSPSLVRVMEAVSANEGKLEAINTWDNAFLSFGIFQWTTGAGDDPGELPALLGRLKQDYAAVFTQPVRPVWSGRATASRRLSQQARFPADRVFFPRRRAAENRSPEGKTPHAGMGVSFLAGRSPRYSAADADQTGHGAH